MNMMISYQELVRTFHKPLILINNYIGDPKLDTLFNQLTAEHKH